MVASAACMTGSRGNPGKATDGIAVSARRSATTSGINA